MIYWHQDDLRTYCHDGKKKVSMPRYYRKKVFDDNGYDMEQRNLELQQKSREKQQKLWIDFKIRNPSSSFDDYWEEKNQRRKAAYIELTNKKSCKL